MFIKFSVFFLPAIVSTHLFSYYPDNVAQYNIRRDIYTNETVTRGRFELIGGLVSNSQLDEKTNAVSLDVFRRSLQCSPSMIEMNGNRGSLNYIKMIPPTRKIAEILCVRFEVGCDGWLHCQKQVSLFRKGGYRKDFNDRYLLVRIINGSIYADWPWGTDRFKPPEISMTSFLFYVTSMISDLKDVVFFLDAEIGTLPWFVPFPVFTNSPSINNVDMPWPWYESLCTELQIYRSLKEAGRDLTKNTLHHEQLTTQPYVKWTDRIPKAAYYGELDNIRHVFFDQVLSREDLFDAGFTCMSCKIVGLDPSCPKEPMPINETDARMTTNKFNGSRHHIKHGTVHPLSMLYIKDRVHYDKYLPGRYKYLVVLTGINALATSARFAQLLAHTGAVILLQHTSFDYHFSSELKPWVHYVPLAYNGADIIEKIEWLQQHDKMAHRIAQNGMNFGRSYLRLEDQMCYVANALDVIADLIVDKDVLIPFNATRLKTTSYHQPIP